MLDGAEGRHAATVRRTRAGGAARLADGVGAGSRAVVRGWSRRRADRLRSTRRRRRRSRRAPRLVLVQALAKGDRDELAVETATELGVDEVVPWQAARSVVVWSGERGERSRRGGRPTVRAAAKQSRRAVVPVVAAEPCDTRDAGGRRLADAAVLVLHEDAEPAAGRRRRCRRRARWSGSSSAPRAASRRTSWTGSTAAGAVAVRLGPDVLRSSSAGPAALAVLSVRLGRGDAAGSADHEDLGVDLVQLVRQAQPGRRRAQVWRPGS